MSVTNMMDRLIVILLLEDEYVGNRDDAAMDLSEYDDPLAERALNQVARDPKVARTIANSCGESLAEIWVRQNRFPAEVVNAFSEGARFGVSVGLRGKPNWLERFNLRSD